MSCPHDSYVSNGCIIHKQLKINKLVLEFQKVLLIDIKTSVTGVKGQMNTGQ